MGRKSSGLATAASCHAHQRSLEERRGQETDGAREKISMSEGPRKGVHDMHLIIGSRLFDWILPRLMSSKLMQEEEAAGGKLAAWRPKRIRHVISSCRSKRFCQSRPTYSNKLTWPLNCI